jgi:anaerobic magnesium-protoporphyrin IX monomethyl ester cyclase
MDILLIHPPYLDPRLDAEDIRAAPIGLYYVAAALTARGHAVEILNWPDMPSPPGALEALIREHAPQMIGFSILHANRWGGIEMARLAKRVDAGITTVFGGIGATYLWEHFLTHFPEIDFVILGEGEAAVIELVQCLESGERDRIPAIAGLAFRNRGRPAQTAKAAPVSDPDLLPMPARFFDVSHLALTRGCASNCSFCGSPAFWGRRVRAHSAGYFVEQMEALRRRGRRFVHVSDDTFTLNKRRAIDVCRLIVKQRIDMAWTAISRVDAVNEEVLAWMRRAGCIQISYGVESGSPAIRRRLGKRFTDGQIRQAFALTQRYGIMARAYFIYGCPGESSGTVQETIDLMRAIKPLGAVFYILDIFPGTALYADMQQRLQLTDDIWLERVEDILYFETDPRLNAEMVLQFGRRLREAFYTNLGGFVNALDPIDEPEFYPLHADFFSRLAMTFDQGDYARIDAIPDKPQVIEALYRRALSYHPDARAYLGLGLLDQKAGRMEESVQTLKEGLSHDPADEQLMICLAVSQMNLSRFEEALALLARCPNAPQAGRLARACRSSPAQGRLPVPGVSIEPVDSK